MKEIVIKMPLQKRSQAKFSAVLAACPRVLAEFGCRRATTAKLALEADISIGSLYDYFSCKEAVFVAYLDAELHKALDQVAHQARYSQQDARQALRALIRSGVDFAHEQGWIIRMLFSEMPTVITQIDLARSRERIIDIAADYAQSQQLTVRSEDRELMLYSLTNIVLGFQLRIALGGEAGFSREQLVEELMVIVEGYLNN